MLLGHEAGMCCSDSVPRPTCPFLRRENCSVVPATCCIQLAWICASTPGQKAGTKLPLYTVFCSCKLSSLQNKHEPIKTRSWNWFSDALSDFCDFYAPIRFVCIMQLACCTCKIRPKKRPVSWQGQSSRDTEHHLFGFSIFWFIVIVIHCIKRYKSNWQLKLNTVS